MKILHLITRMDGGGSAVNTLLTAQHQAEAGHNVVLAFGPSIESDMSVQEQGNVDKGLAKFESLGGQVEVVQSLHRELGWHDKKALTDLKKLISKGFDIVHTHTSKTGALGRMAVSAKNKASGTKVVHTPHGHIFHGYFGALKTKVFLKIEQYLAGKTDVLIALTQAERDDHLALDVGREEQWKVVPSGVDVDAIIHWVWDHPLSNAHKPWDVISVGRLVPIKGMDRLIRAWAIVVKEKPQAKLAILGDGEERRSLERLASQYNIVSNIEFVGWVDPIPHLAKAKSFALLSHNEGMGRVVVEAMAASLPCVVSNVCGLKELVDDSVGCVVDADDTQAVADALLTDWPRDMREAARARAQHYSIATMMQGLDDIYTSFSANEAVVKKS
ncbi:MAG: glycosyltransferase [Ghiorsea sp.]